MRTTPNSIEEAHQAILQGRGVGAGGGTGSPLQLTNCPWCGSPIEPGRDVKVETFAQGRARVMTYCSDPLGQCDFSRAKAPDEGIPVLTVDEEIYRRLPALLGDPDCLRFPVRLVYEFGEMAQHQFAQPDVDWRDPESVGRVLYLRPVLRDHPARVVQAVAYMIPVLNYGDVVTDAHCLSYGATLLGLMEEEFYAAICGLADLVGAAPRFPGDRAVDPSVPACCAL